MRAVRPLTEEERQELQRSARHEVGRVSERMRMILLSSRGDSVPQIAAIGEGDPATVRHWLARFEAEGRGGLRDRPRAGRPRKADAAAHTRLDQPVATAPSTVGDGVGDWTVRTLVAHLGQACGGALSGATVRRVRHTVGDRWRRPRSALPTDPALAAKMGDLCAPVVRRAPEAVLLCLEESDVQRRPVRRAMWMRVGQQVRLPTPGANRKRAVFGAREWTTGRWFDPVREPKRADDFLAFLEQVRLASPTPPRLLVLDNASIHHAQKVTAWLQGPPPPRGRCSTCRPPAGIGRIRSSRSGGA